MKSHAEKNPDNEVALQLVMVELSDGQRGIFIGSPAVAGLPQGHDSRIVNVWFSNIQRIPADISVPALMDLINSQAVEQTPDNQSKPSALQ